MNPNQPQANTGVVTPVPTGGGVVLPNQSPIVSSAPAFGDFVVGNIQLNKYLNEPDPYINAYQAMLGNLQQVNAEQQKNTIASATAETSRTRQQLEQDQNRYLAGMESAGIASGASKYLPQYQEGLMAQARDSYMQKFQQVDQAEKLAIAKAYQARQEGDVMVLREQLGLIEKLRKEKADALENAQRMEWEQYKFKQQMSLDWARENRISRGSSGAGKGTSAGTDAESGEIGDPFAKIKPSFTNERLDLGRNKRKARKIAEELEEAGITSSAIVYTQNKLNEGYSLKQIAQATEMNGDHYELLLEYITEEE